MVPGKVVLLLGPRQVGKTTLLRIFLEESAPYLFLSGEDRATQAWLGSQDIETLRQNIDSTNCSLWTKPNVMPKIGLNLKLIMRPPTAASGFGNGSSSFDLSNQTGEPLVGRKWGV
ncbi:MAG: AAA family ATPase [Haliscomenobacter sp.]|nr:AAA family ATPase [Haliscomenobacter sp.]